MKSQLFSEYIYNSFFFPYIQELRSNEEFADKGRWAADGQLFQPSATRDIAPCESIIK
jgi:hypothetical protein